MLSARFIVVNTKDMSFIIALFVISKFSKDWLIAEKQHRILRKKHTDLNLKLLQSHFEPHFLFNTLNNLYALSLTDFEETLVVIRRFKHLLQFAIVDAQQDKVLLSREVDMIQDYIRIELLRYGTRLSVNTTVNGEINQQVIAPFVLFSLVENCFKHRSSTDTGHPWIELILNCEKYMLYFETKNSIPKKIQSIQTPDNKGFIKLRQRLDLIYSGKFNLVVQQNNQEFTVKLDLELS